MNYFLCESLVLSSSQDNGSTILEFIQGRGKYLINSKGWKVTLGRLEWKIEVTIRLAMTLVNGRTSLGDWVAYINLMCAFSYFLMFVCLKMRQMSKK